VQVLSDPQEIPMFRTLFEASPFPVYLCKGENLIVTIANDATLKAWGKSKDAIGRPFHEVLLELENQPFKHLMLNVYYTGVTHSAVDQPADINVDGTLQTFYFTFSYHPFKEPDGKITGVFCYANDVTELVKARLRLVASEESARLAIEAARLGAFDKDLTTGYMFLDKRCRELFDIPLDGEVTYVKDFFTGIHPDDRDRVNNHILNFAFVKTLFGGNYDIEYRTIGAGDGKTRWIRSRGKVFFNKAEIPVRFMGTVFDITDLKEADEKSAMLSAIIQSSYDAIVTKTLDGIVDSWNEAAERMFGYTAEEMIGQSIYTLITADHHHEEEQILFRLKNGERLEHFETQRLKKDGKLLNISLTISPIKNGKGEIIGMSKIARDITDQKMAEMRKNDFITIASHELKTPLTTIKSYVQLLLGKARTDEDTARIDALSRVDKQVSKMSILIQNFLNNARLLEGKFDLVVERFGTHEILLEIVEDARILSPSHKIVMKDCEHLEVIADRTKICHVMENLIGNAVKYSPVGSTITIGCKTLDHYAQISVSDTGIGIDKKDQTKLFDRFYRVENEKIKNIAGFGIGLYLVAEILRFHDSKICVESISDVGSKFYFDLPIANDEDKTTSTIDTEILSY
jgi:two-component system sensor histidine kinase VicK